jgi:hypothetical protein
MRAILPSVLLCYLLLAPRLADHLDTGGFVPPEVVTSFSATPLSKRTGHTVSIHVVFLMYSTPRLIAPFALITENGG